MSELHDTLRQINESLARIRLFRPIWKNEYSLGPVLTPQEVEAFEQARSCRLPEAYREFLMQVGNGGAGPDCGLIALDQEDEHGSLDDDIDLSLPFPHRDAWNEPDGSPAREDEDLYFSPEHAAGSLIIGDSGCGQWYRLIITGPLAGEMWIDDRHDGAGIHPYLTEDGSRCHFLPWYRDWLARQVYQFGHEGRPRPDPGPGGME